MPQMNPIGNFILTPAPKARSKFAFESSIMPEAIPGGVAGGRVPDLSGPVCIRVARCDGNLVSPPAQILNAASAALEDYKTEYLAHPWNDPKIGPSFRWRMTRSPATGLPAYVRGRLDVAPSSLADARNGSRDWLGGASLARTLLGIQIDAGLGEPEANAAASEAVKKSFPVNIEPRIAAWEPGGAADTGGAPSSFALKPGYHARYQQWHGEWPVFGGAIVVHMTKGDLRTSCTNSYFPIPGDKEPKTYAGSGVIGAEKAIAQARRALQHYIPSTLPAVFHGGIPHPFQNVRRGNRIFFHPEVPPLDWSGEIRCYADQPGGPDQWCVWLPFAGDYRLAYEVRLINPKLPETWSVFVDALTGDALGRPANLACFAPYYTTSEEVGSGKPKGTASDAGSLCSKFMPNIKVRQGTTERAPVFGATSEEGLDFEAINVAVHAREMYDYLLSLGMDKTIFDLHPERQLTAYINAGVTVFNPGTAPTVNFRHDEPGVLGDAMEGAGGSRKVHNPAFDPEVIYHEVVHGLLWALNPDPFEHVAMAAPFARSLVEGYANYFARSLGAQIARESGTSKTHWAQAAFPSAEWGDAWAFGQEDWDEDTEALVGPNLYPRVSAQSLEVYDVGMIWARLLWDLRQIVGREIADRMAMNAFLHAQGTVASFESVAEGLLELLDLAKEVRAAANEATGDDAIQPLLAGRRIVAQRGIQAVAVAGDTVLVGADAGLMRSEDRGQTWLNAELTLNDKNKEVPLLDVIAIAVHKDDTGNILAWYAATESGIFQWGQADALWQAVPGWKLAGRPLSLACAEHCLYIGTTAGVQMGQLSPLAATLTFLRKLPAGDLPIGMVSSPAAPMKLCVAGVSALLILEPNNWNRQAPKSATTDLVTCVAAAGDSVFVGTANLGVREFNRTNGGAYIQDKRSDRGGLNNAVVLSLFVQDPGTLSLLAGTTQGVYRGTRTIVDGQNLIAWEKIGTNLPSRAAVTQVNATPSGLLAGTSFHGLWKLPQNGGDAGSWQLVEAAQWLAGQALPSIGAPNAPSREFVAAATETQNITYLFPFQVFYAGDAGKLSVSTSPPNPPVTLFRLRPNIITIPLPGQALEVERDFYAVELTGVFQDSVTITVSIS